MLDFLLELALPNKALQLSGCVWLFWGGRVKFHRGGEGGVLPLLSISQP